jgi:deoxycytidine triphosphate deaminase
MLSNVELRELLQREDPIVKHVAIHEADSPIRSPLQPASIDLHVGEIVVPPVQEAQGLRHPRKKYTIPSGGSVVVLTHELINFGAEYAGLMFPKSSDLAERGILLTNFGHVDPGYKGHLRYAIINLGSEPYEIRMGDPITCLCVFDLKRPADPDWAKGRQLSERRTEDFVRALSPDLLSIRRIKAEASSVAEAAVYRSAAWTTILGMLIAIGVGVLSSAVALALAWYTLFAPQLDVVARKLDRVTALQKFIPTAAPFEKSSLKDAALPRKSPDHTSH